MTFRFLEELANQTNISNQPFPTFPHCGWPQLLSHGLLHVIPAIGGWFLTKKRGQHPRYKLTPGGLTQRVDLRITQVFNREFHMDNFRLKRWRLHFFSWLQLFSAFPMKITAAEVEDTKTESQHNSKHSKSYWMKLYVQHLQEQSFSKLFPRVWFGSSLFLLKKTFIFFFWVDFACPVGRLMFTWRSFLHHPIVNRKGKIWKNGKHNVLVSG